MAVSPNAPALPRFQQPNQQMGEVDRAQLSRLKELEGLVCSAYAASIVLEDYCVSNFTQAPDEAVKYSADEFSTFLLNEDQVKGFWHLIYDMGDRARKIHTEFYAALERDATTEVAPTAVARTSRKAVQS